ncbi:glycoside hydrolase superfamily [Mycena rosella]|uniref:alpha-amylase n=1 Tax=Mycena rosella TaxID=1033263 RepID=A0AAD7CV29_MYCRO|nr:glycoside hydrolase superfamily [Mycena rosella]
MVAPSSKTFLLALPLLSYVAANAVIRRSPPKAHDVIVQLFEWPWESVAAECTNFLGPFGYGYAQVSPAMEHITGDQWWTDYQPVSYILTSKRGDRTQYANMVSTCAAAGVGIIQDGGLEWVSLEADTRSTASAWHLPPFFLLWPTDTSPAVPYTSSNFHYCAGNGEAAGVTDLNNVTNVRFCELDGLADLAQEQPAVQDALTAYLEDLLSLGVSGFRVDAAAYMEPANLSAIYSALSGSPYRTQEVYDGGASNPPMYDTIGDVIEFGATSYVMQAFLGTSGTSMTTVSNLVTPVPMNTAWDLIPSNFANFIMANQDTERSSPSDSLNYLSPNNAYVLGAIFMLGFNYGTPTIYSGYDYATYNIGAPQDSNGNTSPVTCFENGWRCEQEWIAIANMVLYHNAVGSAALTNVFVGTEQQVAFGRGSTAFLVINNEGSTWTETFTTSLPAGTYCDIIHDTDTAPNTCSGPSYIVSSLGQFTASIAAYDALALFSGFS